MTDAEIIDWLSLLVDPYRTKTRFRMIKDLLDNANNDEMSVDDRRTCVRALRLIEANPKLDYLHQPTKPVEDLEDDYEH